MTIDPTGTVKLSTVLYTAAVAVVLPLAGWFGKVLWGFSQKYSVLEYRVGGAEECLKAHKVETKSNLDGVSAQVREVENRVQRSEDAMVEMRGHVQRADEQFACIMIELKEINKLSTAIASISPAISKIVPREEIDARFKAVHDRVLHMGSL